MRIWALMLVLCGCRIEWGAPTQPSRATGGKVLIYTSAYPPVVVALAALAKAKLPEIELEFFQAGSEKLAARLDAELAAGTSPADLLMASDPMYYLRLKRQGRLQPFASVPALRLGREWVDPDGAFVACRLSVVGLAYLPARLSGAPPERFADLLAPRLKATLPDPLGSGTMFTTALLWHEQRGARFFAALRAARVTSSGGGTAVMDRLLRGEADVGVALVENVAMARAQGADVRFVVPKEGAVIVPGYLAMLKISPAAARVYELLLGPEAQRIMIEGFLHSPFEDQPPPAGAPKLSELGVDPASFSVAAFERRLERVEEVKHAWASAWRSGAP